MKALILILVVSFSYYCALLVKLCLNPILHREGEVEINLRQTTSCCSMNFQLNFNFEGFFKSPKQALQILQFHHEIFVGRNWTPQRETSFQMLVWTWQFVGTINKKIYKAPMHGTLFYKSLDNMWYSTIKTCTVTRRREWKKDWLMSVIYPHTRDGSCRLKYAINGYLIY